jgi:large subunit ribosomal protein L25
MKRMRQAGQIPAVLYGHGQDTVMLALSEKELNRAIDHGSHIVQLKGAANESALIKQVQWNAFGSRVLHIDLTRVDANEAVEVTLPLELKGETEAPGARAGGVINFVQHQVTILCPANVIPEKIEVKINELEVNQIIHAKDVPLPEGASLAENEHNAIVTCAMPAGETEEEAVATEPEVIGKKDEEE